MAGALSEEDQHVKPEESLVAVVGEPGLLGLLETAEAVVHAVLDEGVLKELPVVGIAVRVVGIGRNLRERLFLQKLLAFLGEVAQVGDEERERFVRELDQDALLRQRTGEALLGHLDRMVEIMKATLLGRFFGGLLQRRISRATFDQLAWSLDRFFLQDLEGLKVLYERNYPEPEVGARLANAGLATSGVITAIGGAGVMIYSINPLGT